MEEKDLIFDWNLSITRLREPNNHPHELWFDDETLRDGLQALVRLIQPSSRK